MILGYNTNGWANHRLEDAIEILAEIGYRSVAITIDHGALAPGECWQPQLQRISALLRDCGMSSVIETGARYVLDPRRKHYPTLLSATAEARHRRMNFIKHAVECAVGLGSRCVSLWSGAADDQAPASVLWDRLIGCLKELCPYAAARGVVLGFEPEPGMFIATLDDFKQLLERYTHPALRLTLDVGHVHCQQEGPLPTIIARWADQVVNVHIEDMRRGVHEHLMFGEGEMDFCEVLGAFVRSGYQGPLHVELSRHSHDAPRIAREAFSFLTRKLREVDR